MFLERLPEFFANHMILVTAFVALLAFLVSGEVAQLMRKYKALTPAAFTLLINRGSPLLVDMSSNKDFDAGHIVGAKHMPLSQFDPEHKDLARLRELPVAVYCGNGQTSAAACARLTKAGFKQVSWLDGGLAAWRAASMPVTREKPESRRIAASREKS